MVVSTCYNQRLARRLQGLGIRWAKGASKILVLLIYGIFQHYLIFWWVECPRCHIQCSGQFIGPGGLCVPPEVAFATSSCYYQLLAFLSFSLSSFTSIAFDPLQGNYRGWNFVSPIFCHNLKNYEEEEKKGNFNSFTKNNRFWGAFSTFYDQRSLTDAWATPSPWRFVLNFSFWKQPWFLLKLLLF